MKLLSRKKAALPLSFNVGLSFASILEGETNRHCLHCRNNLVNMGTTKGKGGNRAWICLSAYNDPIQISQTLTSQISSIYTFDKGAGMWGRGKEG